MAELPCYKTEYGRITLLQHRVCGCITLASYRMWQTYPAILQNMAELLRYSTECDNFLLARRCMYLENVVTGLRKLKAIFC